MNWLSRLSVAAKLATVVCIALAALAGTAVNNLLALNAAGDVATGVIDHELAAVKRLGQARASVGNLRRYEKDMFLNMGDEKAFDSYLQRWRKEGSEAEKLMSTSAALMTAADKPQFNAMLAGLANYRKGLEGLVQRIATGQLNDPWAANKAMEPMKADVRAMDQSLDQLTDTVSRSVDDERTSIIRNSDRQLWTNGATVLLAAVGLAGLGWVIGRSITQPLQSAVLAMQRVADGDLTHEITTSGSDEVAVMVRQLAATQVALRRLAGEMRDGACSVATASAQIAQGNADLSSRTEQQAASLEQTAASMEQLTSTVRASSDSARQAHQMAQGASAAAVRGGEAVARVVQTMGDIQAASKRIGDITGVIDGIAFQTNILALNAAVEAARAGEQGRGFAVVASEVRLLAQRSADAARQIKTLIGASSTQVEAGGELVQDAGATIQSVVEQVRRVADLIGEITAAASEQQQGIDQVGQAVIQLDHTTQQNAALVEESAAASESLKAQAARLAAAVAVFRLERSAA
jgi:methyl-accepting chemotaxis protein